MPANFKEQLAAALAGNNSADAAPSAPQDSSAFASVARIIAATSQVDEERLTRDTRLAEDLSIDSLTLLEIGVRLEDKCGVELEAHDLAEAGTVGAIAVLIEPGNQENVDG